MEQFRTWRFWGGLISRGLNKRGQLYLHVITECFHILLLLSDHMLFMIEQTFSTRADVPGVWLCWLTECVTGTFSLTDRDKAWKAGLSRLKRHAWYAYPCSIHSDRGGSFISHETRSFLTERGISFSTSPPYHRQGNGQCERINHLENYWAYPAGWKPPWRTVGKRLNRGFTCGSIVGLSLDQRNASRTFLLFPS